MTSTTGMESVSLESFTRRAVRAWWADGLWDLAVAGFLVLSAGWAYILMRVATFPTWTWPWPFITDEVVNPMQVQFAAWIVGIIPVVMAYMWLAYRLVNRLKKYWLASRQGYAQHGFWLKVEPRFFILYLGMYLGLWVCLIVIAQAATGSPRWLDMVIVAALSAVSLALGSVYRIYRYLISGIIGLVTSTLAELILTTPADYMHGPRSFLDVPAEMGNPAIPLLIWAALFVVTGLYGLLTVLRREPAEEAV